MVNFPSTGIFYFKFKKVDGSIRYAAGTADQTVIENYHTFSTTKTGRISTDTQTYFDMDALAFRSFKKDNFLGMITEEEYEENN